MMDILNKPNDYYNNNIVITNDNSYKSVVKWLILTSRKLNFRI